MLTKSRIEVIPRDSQQMVDYNRNWCLQAVKALKSNQTIKPYHKFLSGAGGVGKIFVLKLVEDDIK